jgi:hypothetical protein
MELLKEKLVSYFLRRITFFFYICSCIQVSVLVKWTFRRKWYQHFLYVAWIVPTTDVRSFGSFSLSLCVMVASNHYRSCCSFLWFTFPCLCVWWSPAIITDPDICSFGSLFLVPVCAVIDNHYRSCSLFPWFIFPCVCVYLSPAIIAALACRFCLCPTYTRRSWIPIL